MNYFRKSRNNFFICKIEYFFRKLIANGSYEWIQTSSPTSVIVFWLFLFCHSGDKLTQRFEDVGDNAYAFVDWYMLPVNMQKSFTLIIALGQRNVFLRGFGGTRCTKEMFMKVRICIHSLHFIQNETLAIRFSDIEKYVLLLYGAKRSFHLKNQFYKSFSAINMNLTNT